jgi:Ser/Thr protein kinase RdoA (MazF antagonist)
VERALSGAGGRQLVDVVARFATNAAVVAVEPFSGPAGHINASYVVTARRGPDDRPVRFFLQRLNSHVFPDLRGLMENVSRVTHHVGGPLRLISTREGTAFYQDDAAEVWRLYDFIEGAVPRAVPTAADAERAARAFGAFQRRLVDLPGPRLHETIPHFHDTPRRLESLECAVQRDPARRLAGARHEVARVRAHGDLAAVLVQAAAAGAVPERVVHNDAKLANVLFDAASGEALCVVDLDTVMPGIALYDFGDLVRSMATRAAEDERDLGRVRLEPELFERIARGYLAETGDLLTRVERELLVPATQVIVFEQAIRFLIDHLEGDRYYRIARPGHNLDRCRTQLTLLAALLEQEHPLRRRITLIQKDLAAR